MRGIPECCQLHLFAVSSIGYMILPMDVLRQDKKAVLSQGDQAMLQ